MLRKIRIIEQEAFTKIIDSLQLLRKDITNGVCVEASLKKISDIQSLLMSNDYSIPVTTVNGRISCVVRSEDVSVIETDGRFLKVYLRSGERYILSKMTLVDVIKKWPGVFIRINRNILVNISTITSLHKRDRRFEFEPIGYGSPIDVSRRNVKFIKDIISLRH